MKEITNKRIIEAKKTKDNILELKGKAAAFFKKIELLNWYDLEVDKHEDGGLNFYVTLSDALISEFNVLKAFVDRESENKEIFHYIVWGHPDDSLDEIEWRIGVYPIQNNRIHINDQGLPFSFREKGLGKKIYKRILKEVGYISTRENKAYKYSHLLWESIIRDSDFFCFVSDNEIIAVLNDNVPDDFLKVLEKSFGDREDCLFDPRFCKIYKTELQALKISKHCV